MNSILSIIRNEEPIVALIAILSRCFIVFCCLPLHELAHAYAAYKLGDDTAKHKGRLTLNPLAHLDLIGTIMIFLIGMGYAKPVPVSVRKLKHPRKDMALIALAGPASNLLIAFFSMFISYALLAAGDNLAVWAVGQFFYYAAAVNVSLAVFNFIPVPPLDGSRILTSILPDKIYFKIMQYERYIMIGFMAIVFFGLLDTPISFITGVVLEALAFIPKLIFGV